MCLLLFCVDLPGIASGDKIGFLDPHKTCFGDGQSGQMYLINENLSTSEFRGQFLPFQDVFGFDISKNFHSTLFRFPLRNCESKLTNKTYTKEKVASLFKSLHEEGPIILLFMKNIQHIGVYCHDDKNGEVCLFEVEISSSTREEVKQKRYSMLENAAMKISHEFSCVIETNVSENSKQKMYKWLVFNQIAFERDDRIKELSESLSLLPWVGCAIPLNDNAKNEKPGRIFCYLPLPCDDDSLTGLPVLVHGAFGVTKNRRGLLWPGSECQNNETAEWNVLLLQKILSSVLCHAFKSILNDDLSAGFDDLAKRDLIYSTLPNLDKVVGHWECLIEPLFKEIKNLDLFFAQTSRTTTSLVALENAYLDYMMKVGIKEITRNAVVETLLSNSTSVVSDLPDHVRKIIEKYFDEKQKVTPKSFNCYIKSNTIPEDFSREKRLLLLEYILIDNPSPEDLNDVDLLPLASKSFVSFKKHCHNSDPSSSVFVPNGQCSELLIPNFKHRFLDMSISPSLLNWFKTKATGSSNTFNSTQLINLTPELVIECIKSNFPEEWSQSSTYVLWDPVKPNHPPKSWIHDIWQWINHNFKDLEQFEGIPLIPLKLNSRKALGLLSSKSKLMFRSDVSHNDLPLKVRHLLVAVGAILLPFNVSMLYVHHPNISNYIKPPSASQVTLLIGQLSIQEAKIYIENCSKEDRKVLQNFFIAKTSKLVKKEIDVLRSLPLLETLDGKNACPFDGSHFLKVASQSLKLPNDFCFKMAHKIISLIDFQSSRLVELLELDIMVPEEMFCKYLFPDIRDQKYTVDETTKIMLWILERKYGFHDKLFLDEVKELPFVSTGFGGLKIPRDLFDPNDADLCNLFHGETQRFPSNEYSNLISTLLDFGLRTRETITITDLLSVARNIEKTNYDEGVKKAQALLHLLPESFIQNTAELDDLKNIAWLPRAMSCNSYSINYPTFMHSEWYKSKRRFFRPSELYRQCHVRLVASSAPILGIEVKETLQDHIGIQKHVDLTPVIEQLKSIIRVWDNNNKCDPEMVRDIYLYLSSVNFQEISKSIFQNDLLRWIWHGKGFCSAENIAFEKEYLPFELQPPLYLLPDNLNDGRELTQLFKSQGVRKQFSKEDIVIVLNNIREAHEKELFSLERTNKDLNFCRSILEWLVSNDQQLTEELRKKIYVPVQDPTKMLVLKECKECAYCDQDWLRDGRNELDIPEDVQLIHDCISPKIAQLLGVPSLSTCLLSAESFEFEQTGPYEPITRRIKNILKEYKEGVGIFKELIQNADDAGASIVKFLVDWRTGKTDSLFSREMAVCQGPALWAFNNAVFTDNDLENINKLAGGTKEKDVSKIGRFGLGFNAVYHLTDVPSFVSRTFMCIFDPNVNHIANHIRDKCRPGIRIDLAKNSRPFTAFADQFSLYNNVFKCKTNLSSHEKFNFKGTLFRFPFRTEEEAKKSEISETVYNSAKVKEIIKTLEKSSHLLLLFTQNVKSVELYEVSEYGDPLSPTCVLCIKKEFQESHVPRLPFISVCSKWWQENSSKTPPSYVERVKIVICEGSLSVDDKPISSECQHWFIVYGVGKDRSIRFAKEEGEEHGLMPIAAAASRVYSSSEKQSDYELDNFSITKVNGEAFCFLPLSIATGLPVHVNSSFAVRSNRDGIWERTTTEENFESRWNECLLEDAIPEVYFLLLENLKSVFYLIMGFPKSFYDLWPCLNLKNVSWELVVSSFYIKLVKEKRRLFHSNGQWLNIFEGYILDHDLRGKKQNLIIKTLRFLDIAVFDLPFDVTMSMQKAVDVLVLKQRFLSLVTFFENFFFPNLSSLQSDFRNPILLWGLHFIHEESRDDHKRIFSLYRDYECIPCCCNENLLRRPDDLINPNDDHVKLLFDMEENRFPQNGLNSRQLEALDKLGMVKDLLSWKEIQARAKSVEKLLDFDLKDALRRSHCLIKYLRQNIERLNENDPSCKEYSLCDVKFLPVCRTPPSNYTLKWKGSHCQMTNFYSPNELFLPRHSKLVGSACLIVDNSDESGCGAFNLALEDILGFLNRTPNFLQVWEQLEIAKSSNMVNSKEINSVCEHIYHHLQTKLKENHDADIVEKLRTEPWIFLCGKFIANNKVALKWTGHAEPYLYSVPYKFKENYGFLLEVANIKKSFSVNDFLQALDSLSMSRQKKPLAKKEMKLVVTLSNELYNSNTIESVKLRIGTIPLPDLQSIFCKSKDLTVLVDDFRVRYKNPKERYLHNDISAHVALKLGAKTIRERRREKYGNTLLMSFGQHEELTDRIKNILGTYPCDVGILKELVQNADDAKATEIVFIYDKRTLPSERVLQDNAKEIQGPALCVYNNRPFSEDDFNGICNLGIGSKQSDPSKTGQYGIGFNAVYHLTDCPSFLSNDDTLCILDPHCEYCPEATNISPGGRYNNIDEDFRDVFSDTMSGFLASFWPLNKCTMFRLPLRTSKQALSSRISHFPVTDKFVAKLLESFQCAARKVLLFLNNVKKIEVWKINEDGNRKCIYSVDSKIKYYENEKRFRPYDHLQKYKSCATFDIPHVDILYKMHVKDSSALKESWLIHQNFGIKKFDMNESVVSMDEAISIVQKTIPDVSDLGLFPRGGVAALLSSSRPHSEEYVAYCFLPLPVETHLPLHVNGHFALDGSRRDLWFDPKRECRRTKWNNFMKKMVLAPSFASLISAAKFRIPHSEIHSGSVCFSTEDEAVEGLDWYHNLFPNFHVDSKWKNLVEALYESLKNCDVLPVTAETHETHLEQLTLTASQKSRFQNSRCFTRCTVEWLCASTVYFVHDKKSFASKERETQRFLVATLLQIRMPVLQFTPLRICEAFEKSGIETNILSPETTIYFLRNSQDNNSRCDIGKLPLPLVKSKLENTEKLESILMYCMTAENIFLSNPVGLPLLLTQDEMLRVFQTNCNIYCSAYSDLFPDKSSKFVYDKFVSILSKLTPSKFMHDLTIPSLAEEFMPDMFMGKLSLGEKKHIPFRYQETGALSKKWFGRLWKFLTEAKLENKIGSKNNRISAIKHFLGVYPIIPTKDEALATVDSAKTVLASKFHSKENSTQKHMRKILIELDCPILDSEIVEQASSIVQKLVADPNCVSDVLCVLKYMHDNERLVMSKLNEKKIERFLKFFDADSENKTSMNIAKTLPFFRGVDDKFHCLSSYKYSVVVSKYLPQEAIRELQDIKTTEVLFLYDFTDLRKLYVALGINVYCSHHQFHIEYVLPSFSSLCRQSQIDFLISMRDDNTYTTNTELLNKLQDTSCIPEKNGRLRLASSYFNPRNELFQMMFSPDEHKFPNAPFDQEEWHCFLLNIGMHEKCDEAQFIQFAKQVAQCAKTCSVYDDGLQKKSMELVRYLLGTKREQNWSLEDISTIKFIIPDKVEEELSSIHPQYSINGKLEFLSFKDSMLWNVRYLVWTSAPLLPEWATANSRLLSSLKIANRPPLDIVIKHVRKISQSALTKLTNGNVLNDKIAEVYKSVYDFFEHCKHDYENIGNCLSSVPCIFLHAEKRLVEGKHLSFENKEEKLKPHFHVVPRNYTRYENFLKSVGVTEKITAEQMVHVLHSIKNFCNNESMREEEKQQAFFATATFFESLLQSANNNDLCELKLSLPSTSNELVESNQLFFKVQPRLEKSVKEKDYKILIPLEKCGLKREREDDYIAALPKKLRPTPLSELVTESLDDAKSTFCSDFRHATNMHCSFIANFVYVLRSSHFKNAILRLLKHQKGVSTLDERDKEKAARFTFAKVCFKVFIVSLM